MNEQTTPVETPASDTGIVEALPNLYGLDDGNEKRTLRWTLVVAGIVHALLLIVTFPTFGAKPLPPPQAGKVFRVETVRFRPPPPKREKAPPPKPKVKKIPIPDPTPDEPEPIEVAELEVPEIDAPEIDDAIFGIPDAPPGLAAGPTGPLQVGGDVRPPEKIYSPQPKYTEEARKARLQGAVILQTVIDTLGNVTDVKVLKGLTLGLTESAIDTVRQWRFEPATQNGRPVPVYFNLVVTFSVQ